MRARAPARTASCAARRLLAEVARSAVDGLVAASFGVTAAVVVVVVVAGKPRATPARRAREARFCGLAALACALAARALLCAARRASWNGRILLLGDSCKVSDAFLRLPLKAEGRADAAFVLSRRELWAFPYVKFEHGD